MNKKRIIFILGIVILVSFIALNLGGKTAQKTTIVPNHKEKIAVIYVNGVITAERRGAGLFSEDGDAMQLMQQLHRASEDPAVKAIVLRINSPGGSVTATQEIGEEIQKIRDNGMLVVTSMGDIAASGGYWLAACTDKIYANSTTLTGSIGVYMPYSNWEELYQKIGIRSEKIKSGEHKDILANDRPMTGEERQILQTIVNENYEEFVSVVAQGRNMTKEEVRALADGRIYTGRQALEAGLVDRLGNIYDVVAETAKEVGIQGTPELKEYGKTNPFSALLESSAQQDLLQELFSQFRTQSVYQAVEAIVPMAIPQQRQG